MQITRKMLGLTEESQKDATDSNHLAHVLFSVHFILSSIIAKFLAEEKSQGKERSILRLTLRKKNR